VPGRARQGGTPCTARASSMVGSATPIIIVSSRIIASEPVIAASTDHLRSVPVALSCERRIGADAIRRGPWSLTGG